MEEQISLETVRAIHTISPETLIELLIPDFKGNFESLEKLIETSPSIIGHNLETVRRLYGEIRSEASYERSLEILKRIKEYNPKIYTKSSLMLGLGEEKNEILEAMRDLVEVGCDILVLGQYLAPSKGHFPVKRFVPLEEFEELKEIGLSFGFKAASCGPLVRSSYQASQIYKELDASRNFTLHRS
jgi:lipoic acid synthetase